MAGGSSHPETGKFWFYAIDHSENVSEHVALIVIVGINGASTDPAISISPNPTRDFINIQGLEAGFGMIEIYSISGQLLYQEEYFGNDQRLDLSGLRKGLYFIRIKSEEFVRPEKIIRQ